MATLDELTKEQKEIRGLQNTKQYQDALARYRALFESIHEYVEQNHDVPDGFSIDTLVADYHKCMEMANNPGLKEKHYRKSSKGFGKFVLSAAGLIGITAALGYGAATFTNKVDSGQESISVVYPTKTPQAVPSIENTITKTELRNAVKNEESLQILSEIFAAAYSGITPDKAQQPIPRFSTENAANYLKQLVDGKLEPADKSKSKGANPELVSITTGMEGQWPTITVEYEAKNSAGQTVSMTNNDAQKFYFDAQAGQLYLIRFNQIIKE